MSKTFNEFDRERCQHCGKWDKECSLSTLPIDIEGYGQTAICSKCLKEYDREYWIQWMQRKFNKK